MFRKNLKYLLFSFLSLILFACDQTTEDSEETTLTVASHLPPMTDIVEIAAENIEEPYSIELMEVSDNIQYNEVVQNDEAFASFAQHEPFMEQYNEANDGDLIALQTIYDPIVGFYSPTYDSVDDIEEGAEVAIPNDLSNETRSLLILEDHGLLELDKDVKATEVTLGDITNNPLDLQFSSVDLLNLTAAYEDGIDLVFNMPTYIASIDLTPDDALILEDPEDTLFALIVAIREKNADTEATEALIDAFTSEAVYDYLVELADVNHLYPAFEDPRS